MFKVSHLILVLFIVFQLFTTITIFSQDGKQEEGLPFIKRYTPKDYNAHGQNFAITQDNRGIMYFGNFAGILEFDGINWNLIPTENGMKVSAIAIDHSGKIYAGSFNEFGFLTSDKTGQLRYQNISNSLPSDSKNFGEMIGIFPTNEGIYFVSQNRVILYRNNQFKIWKLDSPVFSSFYVNNKLYFFNRSTGLIYLDFGKFRMVAQGSRVPKILDITGMFHVDKSTVIIATGHQGLFKMTLNSIDKLNTDIDNSLIQNGISGGILLDEKTLLLGNNRGGMIILNSKGKVVQKNSNLAGLQHERINNWFKDKNKNIWVALNNGIAIVETPSPLTYFSPVNNLQGEISGIIKHNGTMYFASDYGLFYLDDSEIKTISNINIGCWGIQSFQKSLLVATSKGVYQVIDAKARQITQDFSLSMYRSKYDSTDLYVGLSDGISMLKYLNGNWKNIGKLEGIDYDIRKITEDEDANIWLETSINGIIKIIEKDKKITFYDTASGLPSNLANHINIISDGLYVTTNKGIFKYDKSLDRFGTTKLFDLPSDENWKHDIIEDKSGNLVINEGDGRNTSIFLQTNDYSFVKNQVPLLPVSDFIAKVIYPVNGVIWLGGPEGIIRYDMGIKKDYAINYNALIRKVSIGNDSVIFYGTFINKDYIQDSVQASSQKMLLDFKYNRLRFEFGASDYNVKGEVFFQYYLEGFDKIWSEWTTGTQKEYTNLPEGEYVFLVKAKNIYNQQSSEAKYEFSILTPIHRTWWAITVYIIAFVILVYVLIRWRLKVLMKEKQELEETIVERTEEIVSQKQELEKQSVELAAKNYELEKIDMIVQSINSEIHFSNLFQSILEKLKIIKGMERSAALLFDKELNSYRFKAGFGLDFSIIENAQLTLEEAENRYLLNSEEVFEDVFFRNNVKYQKLNNSLDKLNEPKCLLSIVINIDNHIEGFIVIANMTRDNAFDKRDFSMVRNLKEHLVSAVIKTRILEDLQKTLDHLKETQEALIRQEKLASIGQLTKGIVDRILNPLNYINNFSQVSIDLAKELREEVEKDKENLNIDVFEDLVDIIKMIEGNVAKIYDHGCSASRIVKGMEKLLKEKSTEFIETDINVLVESNTNTAYREVKNENKDLNAVLEFNLDKNLAKTKVLPYELSQVMLYLINNACFAVDEKSKLIKDYKPTISVSTLSTENSIEIRIKDNGKGIPLKEMDKLFNPFFTTKPTSKGTGLGLYMSKDIIETHKGKIEVNSKENEFTEFIINLPRI